MIPTKEQCKALWEKYRLPEQKRVHVALVAKTAMWIAQQCKRKKVNGKIDEKLLLAGALLHDIDKGVEKLPGGQHPDTAVRILQKKRDGLPYQS